jgi:hypothetical protein
MASEADLDSPVTVVFPSKVLRIRLGYVDGGRDVWPVAMLLAMLTKPMADAAACASSPRTRLPMRAVTVFSS